MSKPTPLKRIMQDEGRRQSWLAQRIGKDQAEVSRYVNRGMVPPEETRQAIADALDREPAELWPDLYAEAA
jgi:lambda repressor-like predicted transcriptional regulator